MKEVLNAEGGIQDVETGRRVLCEFEPGMIEAVLQGVGDWRSHR